MILAAFLLAAALPQQTPCRTHDTQLPRNLAGWTRAAAGLDTGHATLLPAGRDHRVETQVTIRRAGLFGVAVDSDAWVDLYRARGKALAMASETRGPRCSTIRKIIRYRLRPGTYRVTVEKIPGARTRLMLVRYH